MKIFSGRKYFRPPTLLLSNVLSLQRFDGDGGRGLTFFGRASNLANSFYIRFLIEVCILLPLFQRSQYLVGGFRDRCAGAEYPRCTLVI